jgi:RPA family protein
MPNLRQTAYKIHVKDLAKGKFIKQEGWDPSFIFLEEIKLKVSRVNIVGVVISKTGSDIPQVEMDDGSGLITLRSFNNDLILKNLEVGNIINVIGRVRKFNEDLYLVPEVIKKCKKEEKELWELEITKQVLPQMELEFKDEPVIAKEKPLDESNPSQIIYELIKELDKGEGVEITDIMEKTDFKNTEDLILSLIEEGEIYKISASKIKIL